MTILQIDPDGLAAAKATLFDGNAVLMPLPTPLPYVVAGSNAATVNGAKGRPADQPCGVLLPGMDDIAACVDLDRDTRHLATWIAEVEHANLFLPVRPDAPPWVLSASARGRIGITLACLPQLRPLLEATGRLYVSSGNPTGERVATTARAAHEMFAGRLPVLDGDRFRNPAVPHGSATIVQVGSSGALRVVRDGINNAAWSGNRDAYLTGLRRRFARDRG